MKQGIHPDWHHDTKVTCSCSNTFTIGSITDTLQVDICNKCHPFFTGELKFVDRQGRVDKFKKKMEAAANRQKPAKPRGLMISNLRLNPTGKSCANSKLLCAKALKMLPKLLNQQPIQLQTRIKPLLQPISSAQLPG